MLARVIEKAERYNVIIIFTLFEELMTELISPQGIKMTRRFHEFKNL